MSLKKIKGRKIKLERIWAGDIEAENWVQNFVMGGYYNGENYFLFDKLDEFIEFMLSREKSNPVVYFHNLSYDGVFILEHLIRKNYYFSVVKNGSYIYQIKCRRRVDGKNWVYFRDSYILLRSGLNELGKIFLGEGKLEFDYESDFENRAKLEEYLKRDLYILYNVLIKFFETIDFINAISLSSLSLTKFRMSLDNEIYYKINNKLDEFGRQFYFGSRVEVFRFYGENIYGYDVNSMYPYVMSNFEYPYGKCYFVSRRNIKRIGFYRVRLKFHYEQYIPFLFRKFGNGKLYFLNNDDVEDNIYYLNSYELDLLEEEGYYNYEIIDGVEFTHKGFIFRDYINELYSQRVRAKEQGNKILNYVLKLMLNSLYGKFGQTRKRKTYITEFQYTIMLQKIKSIEDELVRLEKLQDFVSRTKYLGSGVYSYETDLYFSEYMNVYFSALTTSLARIHLYKLLKKYENNVFYCDTDSLFVNCEISEDLISDTELGKLKLEKKFKEVVFLLPKLYAFITIDDKKGSVAKGFKRLIDIQELKGYLFNNEIIFDEYTEPASFLEVMRKMKYVVARFSETRGIKKVIKFLRTKYDKRKVLGNDTYPFAYSELKDKLI